MRQINTTKKFEIISKHLSEQYTILKKKSSGRVAVTTNFKPN